MSASTVSITANPATRRRPVVASEKKTTNIELVGATESSPALPLVDKDLSHHSIRGGDAVLERSSKDLLHSQVKKSMAHNSTVSPRRTRNKVVPPTKPERPRWRTLMSVVSKNLILLVVVLGLVQLIRRLALKPAPPVLGTEMLGSLSLSEFEGRIAEVESFLKSTSKIIQVQVEVVDRKIDKEIGGLKREINNKIEEQGVALKKLEAKSQSLGEELRETAVAVKQGDWLSKEEFDKIYKQLKDEVRRREYRNVDDAPSLDEIRAYAREMIEREIGKLAADGLGRVDYALASGGALVVKHSEPLLVVKPSNWFLMSAASTSRNGVHNTANKMLTPSFGEPGQCFALRGSIGFVQIRLRQAILPEAVTLEHVAKSVAYDRSSAPKDCRVSGWLQGNDMDKAVDAEKMFLLAEFSYDLEKSNAQTFNVLDTAGSGIVDTVRLDFTSNHGSPSHTCIYRFRVHGQEPDSVSMMAMQS